MLSQLLKYIETERLFEPKAKLLCAVSGGIDSMVLLELLHTAGFELAVAHCNFGLRAQASDLDQNFVSQRCQALGLMFFSKKFDTQQFATSHGISTQMAARTLRYDWFNELLNSHSFDYLLTAHHLNDLLETLLLNLSKGTGLAGLRSIKPKQGRVLRPLLFATRQQIENYAQSQNVAWREDASNASNKYQRNLIRHEVVPILQKINPNLEQTLGNTILRLSSTERMFETLVDDFKTNNTQTHAGSLLIKLPVNEVALLHEILKPFGFNFQQSKELFMSQNGLVGRQFFSDKYMTTVDRKQLIVSKINTKEPLEISIEENQQLQEFTQNTASFDLKFSRKNIENTKDPNIAQIDANKLVWPLKLRQWKAGDVFCPLGMGGKKKKLSDFFIDSKIPRHVKNTIYILENGNQDIIWIVGHRLDERFRIGESNQNILNVEIIQTEQTLA